jgi:phosphatidylglycerophosphatase C
MKNTLVLFDFDGTITSKNSLIEFILFSNTNLKILLGVFFLSPILICLQLRLIPNHKAKQIVLSYFYKGMDQKKFFKLSEDFSMNKIDSILRPDAINRIAWHKKKKHTVVVVSASIESWLKPWCEKNELSLIATRMCFENDIVTGRFSSKNCNGIEKVNRIKKEYNLTDFNYIYAYGDSVGDKQMLSCANESFYKPFV